MAVARKKRRIMCLDLTEIKGYNLKIFQRKKGYRFSIDSFLLAWFVSNFDFKYGIEIGAGSGIVSLLIDRMAKDKKHFELVEVQRSFCKLIEKNIEINRPLKGEFTIRCEDARYLMPSFNPDIVFSNPPFTEFSRGKVSPNTEKAYARHTYLLSLPSLLNWYKENTSKKTRLILIESMRNFEYYKETIPKFRLYIEKLVFIKPFEGKNPNLFLISITKTKQKFSEDNLVIYKSKGVYTHKVRQILGIV